MALLLDVALHGVELGVALDHGAGQGDVAAGDAVDGVGDLGLGQAAHAGDLGGQLVQLVAIGLDGVLVHDRLAEAAGDVVQRAPLARDW